MTYVDGFVIPVAKNKVKTYQKMAQMGKKLWTKHGALQYFECVGDDLNPKAPEGVPGMKTATFLKMTKTKPGETVFFSFIVYKSRAHRDAVNTKVMKDPMMSDPQFTNTPMPFDVKRMAYGGFKTLVQA